MVTVFYHTGTPVKAVLCIVFKQFDVLNVDGLAGKRQNVKISLRQNFALYGNSHPIGY